MKKRILSILLVCVMVVGINSFNNVAVNAYTEGIYTYTVSNGEATITKCDISASGDIIIPNTLGEYPVTVIEAYAFYNCSSLTSINIPSTVTSIGYSAFEDCSSITNVIISNGVTFIRSSAFRGCSSLTNIDIPNSVTYIDYSAFEDCSSLTSIIIPSSVTSIEASTFRGCSSLTNVSIPNSVSSIGGSAFGDCSSLAGIEIPNSVTSIGRYAFWNCSNLTSITIPSGVTSIDDSVFYGCSSLTDITIPSSVISIDYGAFYGCSSLTSVAIPSSVTYIGNSAFEGCSSLTSINIPNGITSIGYRMFRYCSSLTSINIPNSVTYIDYEAFYDCSSLTSIDIPSSVTSIGNYAFGGCSGLTSANISNGVTYIGGSAFYNCSSLTSITIPSSVTSIEYEAFYGCKSLTNANISNGVAYIGGSAFYNCSSLTSIDIPNSVTYIGTEAFYGCIALTNVTISNSVTSIENDTFWGCSSLTSINIPNSVTAIGSGVFKYCSSLTSISIPNSVTYIGDNAFYNCSNLTSVTLPISITSIWGSTFSGCSSLTSINIPNSITSIGNYAFSNCRSLTSIIIPNSVTSIGVYAFSNCSNLTSVAIPSSVTSIGSSAFYYCSSLISITIPSSVTSIEQYMFYGCSSLTSISIPSSVTSIGSYAFRDCSNLTSVAIPSSVTSIGSSAFKDCSGLISISIPNSVTYISHDAFYGCSGLTSIDIPNSVTSMGISYVFYFSWQLTNIILQSDVTSIENSAFYDFRSLININVDPANNNYSSADGVLFDKNKSVLLQYPSGKNRVNYVIPSSVNSIGNYAFYDCSSLTSINIPNNVTAIGQQAFYNCSNLTSISIPNSVTAIGENAFRYCNKLTIYGQIGSYAETYANSNGIPFADISTLPPTPEILLEVKCDSANGSLDLIHQNGVFSPSSTVLKISVSNIMLPYGTTEEKEAMKIKNASVQVKLPESVRFKGDEDKPPYILNIALGDMPVLGESNSYREIEKEIVFLPTDEKIDRFDIVVTANGSNVAEKMEVFTVDVTFVKDNRLIYGVDNFSFYQTNDPNNKALRRTYEITQSYYNLLTNGMSNKVKDNIDKKIKSKWGGVCYGMSTVLSLMKIGKLDYTRYGGSSPFELYTPEPDPKTGLGATNPINVELNNLINFYHLSQLLPDIQKERLENSALIHTKDTIMLEKLVREVKNVKRDGIPVVVCYQYNYYNDNTLGHDDVIFADIGRHAVIAFSVDDIDELDGDIQEYIKDITGKEYKYRIEIYDPNYSNAKENQGNYGAGYLYVSADYSNWYYYNIDSTYGKKLLSKYINGVITDINILDIINPQTGNNKTILKDYDGTWLSVIYNDTLPNLTIQSQENGTATISGDNISGSLKMEGPIINAYGDSSELIYYLPEDDIYTISTDNNSKTELTLMYENNNVSVTGDSINNLVFEPTGKVSINGNNTNYELSLTFNEGYYTTPWYSVTASGTNANTTTFEKTDKGIILNTDNMQDVTITANNDNEQIELNIISDKDSLLITNKNDVLAVYEDTNNNGSYDKLIALSDEDVILSIEDLTITDNTVHLTVCNAFETGISGTVIVVVCAEGNKFVEMKKLKQNFKGINTTFIDNINLDTQLTKNHTVKAFIWNNPNDMKPISNVK